MTPFTGPFREKVATGRLGGYALDGEVQMYLGLPDDDHVEIGCENEEVIPRVLLQSSDERLREWGRSGSRSTSPGPSGYLKTDLSRQPNLASVRSG